MSRPASPNPVAASVRELARWNDAELRAELRRRRECEDEYIRDENYPQAPATRPLLHVAAFWVDGDQGDEMADMLASYKIAGTSGAVVTFRPDVADAPDFRHTMDKLDLNEVNAHPEVAA